ncbi:hypothetical protein [Herbaspirillum seropedicae]|uniref:hypothetical protein n=1 Tax=Herbaspirillum seropedicae TaxID=964 RepID=UPI00286B4677|nr:hypothetical protein [Herbaspirillum seropedicae]
MKQDLLQYSDIFERAINGASVSSLAKEVKCSHTAMVSRLATIMHVLIPMLADGEWVSILETVRLYDESRETKSSQYCWTVNKNVWLSALNEFRSIISKRNSNESIFDLRNAGVLPLAK